ncbi:K02A2.6-like [Cordylochernes scorpioides]|uniref:K02A2.6-like n=1 Tax=Cordylochernes scorpioides TaxID=51811 RepID=A0ABY6LVN2_9ARAC|nr:K02A2.6-like [Cordylochernes scorpioides]
MENSREWLKQLKPDYSRLFSIKFLNNESTRNSLMDRYADFFNKDLGCLQGVRIKFNLKKDVTPNEIIRLVNSGILEPIVHANWAAPIVPLLKEDVSVKICDDFKCTAIKAIELDKYPLPSIDEIFSKLSTSTVLSTLDLSHRLTYKLPYGVSVTPNKFQSVFEGLFADLPGVACYIDDILVAENTLKIINKRLKLNRDKCKFKRDSVEYLGFKIDKYGLHLLENNIKSVIEAPEPKKCFAIEIFHWTIYYSRFIKNIANILAPFYQL